MEQMLKKEKGACSIAQLLSRRKNHGLHLIPEIGLQRHMQPSLVILTKHPVLATITAIKRHQDLLNLIYLCQDQLRNHAP
jgi:hypothetical protein